MKGILQKLGARIESSPPHSPKLGLTSTTSNPTSAVSVNQLPEPILHEDLWKRLSSWFQPNDVIITENGTANIGIWDSKFPAGVKAINQTLWGSIGYSVGAAQGASLALKDAGSDSRTILFVGDGISPMLDISSSLTTNTASRVLPTDSPRSQHDDPPQASCYYLFDRERGIHYRALHPWHERRI